MVQSRPPERAKLSDISSGSFGVAGGIAPGTASQEASGKLGSSQNQENYLSGEL
jgi:hypothetical protein